MFVTTKVVFDSTGKQLFREGYEYFGLIAFCKGPSAQQQDLAAKQASFYDTMTKDYNQQFSDQASILSSLKSAWEPILAAGANQYGFSPAEDTALRTQATEGTAAEYQKAAKATNEQLAAEGGGNVFLPSGVNSEIQAETARSAASQESSQQLGITTAGYETGRANFENASNALSGNAKTYDPTRFAGQATGAGNSAFSSATKNYEESSSSGLWGTIGGILGGATGSFLGPMGASIGKNIGSSIGGGGNNFSDDSLNNGGDQYQ